MQCAVLPNNSKLGDYTNTVYYPKWGMSLKIRSITSISDSKRWFLYSDWFAGTSLPDKYPKPALHTSQVLCKSEFLWAVTACWEWTELLEKRQYSKFIRIKPTVKNNFYWKKFKSRITTGCFAWRYTPRDCLDTTDQGFYQTSAICDLECLLVLLVLFSLLLKGRYRGWGHRGGGGGGRGWRRGWGGNRGWGGGRAWSCVGSGHPRQGCFHGSKFWLRLALLKNGRELVPSNGVEFENKNLIREKGRGRQKSLLFHRPKTFAERTRKSPWNHVLK